MDKVLIAIKKSKWERDLIRYGSSEVARNIYAVQHSSYEKIHSSHLRQARANRLIQNAFPSARVAQREELPYLDMDEYDIVISVGGDNHFIYVSHFVSRKTPIIGVNSDPETSVGALLNFNADSLIASVNTKDKDAGGHQMSTESWIRIDGDLEYPDGKKIQTGPCTSEISIRSDFADYISRYRIRLPGEEWEEQKSSGVLLSTGAGSTGWFRNCHWSHKQDDAVFARDAGYFRMIARELRSTRTYRHQRTRVNADQSLEVVSEMEGTVSIDTHPENTYEFPPGCLGRFRISENSLTVVNAITPPGKSEEREGNNKESKADPEDTK